MKLMKPELILLCAAAPAVLAGGFKVTFETLDCNGDTGFASVDIDRIYRIETTDCGPEQPERKLKQVLVRSYATGFDAFSLSEAEAEALQQQLKRYQGARQQSIERGDTIYIERY